MLLRVKLFSVFCFLPQTVRNCEAFTKSVAIIVTSIDKFSNANGIDVGKYTTSPWRETPTKDGTDIAIVWRHKNIFLETTVGIECLDGH